MSERNIAQMFEGEAHNLVWKNIFNEIIDEVYKKYDKLFDSYYPPFSAPYPKRLTKEELVEEIKNGGKVIQEYELGVKIVEREFSLIERYELMKESDNWVSVHYKEPKSMEYMDKHNIPAKQFTLEYKNETVSYYE
jgi:hypothetical protein